MFAGIQTPQTVPLIGIDLQLIRFTDLHEGVNQLAGVIKMDVLVYESVNDQQSILFVRELAYVCQDRAGHVAMRIILRQIHVTLGVSGVVEVPRGDRSAGDGQL